MTSSRCQRLHQALLLLALSAAADVSIARTPLPSALQRACPTAIDVRIELLPVEGKRVSACPPGNDEGCPYSAREGKTFLDGTPDLNNDGREDAILTYFGSSYGGIDVTDKLILAQCADGTYIRLSEGRFTTLTAPVAPHAAWPALDATRDCPAGQNGTVRTEKIQLQFDPAAMRYRGPAGIDLIQVCSE
ncbi:TPA: hypothetical protein ACXNP2_003020 [Stenotrophomonas maltophilia]